MAPGFTGQCTNRSCPNCSQPKKVQMSSRTWPTSKRENVVADALADITPIQLCGFTDDDPNEICPKILREGGLAVLELLVIILVTCGR